MESFLTAFKASLTDLCKMIAKKATHIATSHLTFLLHFNSSRLIGLDNRTDVRPIGIGDI